MNYDYLLVGGGLQSGLLALALRYHRPTATIAIVEKADSLGGNHTWSYHAGDVPEEAKAWFDPLIEWRWSGYDVVFPRYQRTIGDAYASFTGVHLDAVVRAALAGARGCDVLLGAEAVQVEKTAVTLRGGRRLHGRVVIDARGPERSDVRVHTGYQKFVGQELRLEAAHRLERPLLMDASVLQIDGFHFIYVLPFSADRVLIEDTYFSNTARLEPDLLRARIRAWAAARGWKIVDVLREEHGVLPMPYESIEVHAERPLRAGYAGGWFNPATGYSLPVAVRLAGAVAVSEPDAVHWPALAKLRAEIDRQMRFCSFLNRLLFEATAPESRRNIFERVYRLPEGCISRLYSMQLRSADHLRIFWGTPPKGLLPGQVLKAFSEGLWPAIAPSLRAEWADRVNGS